MHIEQWIVGPQLIGAIMMFAGFMQKTFPPTNVDGSYGYRTTTSTQNQQTFDEGNSYSSRLMIWLGAVMIVAGLVIAPFVTNKHQFLTPVFIVLTSIGIPVIVILRTEKHLKKMFDNKTE